MIVESRVWALIPEFKGSTPSDTGALAMDPPRLADE
jgi:hypothetical protein